MSRGSEKWHPANKCPPSGWKTAPSTSSSRREPSLSARERAPLKSSLCPASHTAGEACLSRRQSTEVLLTHSCRNIWRGDPQHPLCFHHPLSLRCRPGRGSGGKAQGSARRGISQPASCKPLSLWQRSCGMAGRRSDLACVAGSHMAGIPLWHPCLLCIHSQPSSLLPAASSLPPAARASSPELYGLIGW